VGALRILHVTPAFYPAIYWGGPIFSVYELCNNLARSGNVDIRVLTTDTSGPNTEDHLTTEQQDPSQYLGYRVHFCRKMFGVDFTPALWGRVWSLVHWANVIHLCSVYSSTTMPVLVAGRMLGRPIIWSPRGALQRWTGSRNEGLKSLWESLCRALIRPSKTLLHVTSQEEGVASSARLGHLKYEVIPNGVDLPQVTMRTPPRTGRALRLLYVGRLDPKKGIENLLQAFKLLPAGHFSLRICGTGDFSYSKTLQTLTSQLGIDSSVTFSGHVSGSDKANAFLSSDICVVPSHTENFGLVVAESLAHGTPVIAATGTPWRVLEAKGAGRWVSNDPKTLAETIEAMSDEDLETMGRRGREWMAQEYSWASISDRMLQIYRNLAGSSKGNRR
jgi:glycosyltransferase involved in cell wall biosynthesis